MKPNIDELAKEVYYTAMRHDGHKDWSYYEEWRKKPWRDAVRHVLDRLNRPETLTRGDHLKLIAIAASDDKGWWWQRIRTGMENQWISPSDYLPSPGESLLVRHKDGAIEGAQFNGQNFHQHSRPDMIIYTHGISEWTYVYEQPKEVK